MTPWTLTPVAVATLPVPGWECVFGRNDSTLRDLVFWVWILRRGEEVGLIDTGCPSGPELARLNEANATLDARSVFTIHRTLPEVLEAEGIAPEAVRFVLLTQLITYATGGLLPGALPNATVYGAWGGIAELFLENPGHPPKPFYFTPQGWADLHARLTTGRAVFAQGPLEVAEGVVFEPTGGHHPGSAGVQVRSARGKVGILETAFVQENVEGEVPIGIAENAAECREAIRRYRRECALTLAGHEPETPRLLAQFLEG